MVDSTLKCVGPLGNIGYQGEALLESFELPQYILDMPRGNDPYHLVMSYNTFFFDTGQYMFISH